LLLVFFHYRQQSIYFSAIETTAALNSYGVKPDFCHLIVSFDMDMRWLFSVYGVKEETKMAYT